MQQQITSVIVVAETALEMRSSLRTPVRAGARRRTAIAVAWLLWWLLESAAMAHTQARPLENWGPFLLPGTVDCLRVISRAAHFCFDTVLVAEQRCRDVLMRGETCDTTEVDAIVSEATREVRATTARSCTVGQLTELGYFGLADAALDMFNACVTQARAAVAATYAPALAGSPEQSAVECMTVSAAYGRKVMSFVLRQKTPVMERMATHLFTKDEKTEFVLQVETELSAARARWATGLRALCPQFAAVYGRDPDGFLRTLKQRADCVLSNTYVNTANFCPSQICGNGVPEPGEQCDDGNQDDTDTCRTNCTSNPSP